MSGVKDAIHGLKWVMLLTFMVLYASAIVFTTLVGRGVLWGGHIPKGALENFGSVPQSMFMLFKLMNDDQSVIQIQKDTESVYLKFMFVAFMVLSNWAILAILTSVVSDHMIASTQRAEKMDEALETEKKRERSLRMLKAVFNAMDTNSSGYLSQSEFVRALSDKQLCYALCESSGLNKDELVEVFMYCSQPPVARSLDISGVSKHQQVPDEQEQRVLSFDDFITHVSVEGNTATERAVMRLEDTMRGMEERNQKRFEHVLQVLKSPGAEVDFAESYVPGPASRLERKRQLLGEVG